MLEPLRHRNFRLFWTAELASRVGFWLQTVGLAWLAWHVSGSPMTVGLVTMAALLPGVLLAPVGGMLADRLPRRGLLLTTQMMLSLPPLVLWRLAGIPHPDLWLIALTATVGGALGAVDTPTRLALVPGLVPRDVIPRAVAVDAGSVTLARLLGPALAALVIPAAGAGACFLLNSLSYLPVIVVLPALRVAATGSAERARRRWFVDLQDGLRFARRTPDVRTALIVLAVCAVLTLSSSTVLPVFADRELHAGASGLGLLLAAQGSGALLGAFVWGRQKVAIAAGQSVLAPALVAWGALVAFAATRATAPALALLVIVGIAQSRLVIGTQRCLQSASPEHLRGRVMALFSQVMLGGLTVGALLAGSLTRLLGAPLTIATEAAAAATLVACLVWGRFALEQVSNAWRRFSPARPDEMADVQGRQCSKSR